MKLRSVLVRDHMATQLVTLAPDTGILEAAWKLIRHDISGAPVLDEHGVLVGIITERDFMRAVVQGSYHGVPKGRVRDFMTSQPETVEPDTSILDVADRFIEGSFRRYPVLEDGRLVGMISRRDVMRAIGEHYPA